jgi:hypothetical protein
MAWLRNGPSLLPFHRGRTDIIGPDFWIVLSFRTDFFPNVNKGSQSEMARSGRTKWERPGSGDFLEALARWRAAPPGHAALCPRHPCCPILHTNSRAQTILSHPAGVPLYAFRLRISREIVENWPSVHRWRSAVRVFFLEYPIGLRRLLHYMERGASFPAE